MPLRLFGGGNARIRACPACERKVKAEATFCPSCYMVFRPEGAAALREFLQGARIPADVYLLRKLQTEDPNTGPVTRMVTAATEPARQEPVLHPPPPAVEAPQALAIQLVTTDQTPVPEAGVAAPVSADPPTVAPDLPPPPSLSVRRTGQKRNGVEGLLLFEEPLPPPAETDAKLPDLWAWMLEHDSLIPNNLARLSAIHAAVFSGNPVAQLGYEQHILLQVADDLCLHPGKDALGTHLGQLAAMYRRAADAYRRVEGGGEAEINAALWQMASIASRLRMEAWVYRTRHGDAPHILSTRQRELPLHFVEN